MSRKNRNKNQKTQDFTRSNAAVQPRTETYEQPTDASPVAPESLMSEPVWTDIDNRQPKRGLRIFAVVVALIVTVIIAIGAGGLLAMVDLEIKPHDLYGAVTGKDVDEAVQAAQEEYESIFAAASEKITVDLGEYETEEPADEAQTSEEAGEDTEEDTKKTEFAVGASSEIAGIGEVISAGTNDIIVYKPADDGSSAPSTTVINDPNANYPLPFSTVDLSYFDDALFIGDSRMLGFGMYSGLTNATFYAVTSFSIFRYETMPVVQTPNGKVPIFDALPYDQFTKVYIKVGLNELGGSDASFIKVYDEFVTKIRQMEPRAIIYTHAILPETAEKSRTDHTHSNENINARNEALKQYAEEHQCYYIDIKPVVSEPDGSLMPEMAGDGIHLKAGYMELWKEYLRTHAVIF